MTLLSLKMSKICPQSTYPTEMHGLHTDHLYWPFMGTRCQYVMLGLCSLLSEQATGWMNCSSDLSMAKRFSVIQNVQTATVSSTLLIAASYTSCFYDTNICNPIHI